MHAVDSAADDGGGTDTESVHSGRSSVVSVSKSVEKLMGEFQLSVSLDAADDSAYLKSQSIENIESETDELFDDLLVFDGAGGQQRQRQRAAAMYTAMSPSRRVTIPADGAQFRARVLSFGSVAMAVGGGGAGREGGSDNGVTDIW